MNLCSVCLQKAGLVVPYPQLLTVVKWCDGCKKKRMALDIEEVVKQMMEK